MTYSRNLNFKAKTNLLSSDIIVDRLLTVLHHL